MPKQGFRVMLFVAGPPTVGQGLIVSRAKTENIRSYLDLQKSQAPHFKASAVANHMVVDVFACSLDQVGTLECKVAVQRSGCLFMLGDSFR